MSKSDSIHMRIAPELKERLSKAARARFIDVSALVTLILGSWLEANDRRPIDAVAPQSDPDVSPPGDKDRGH